jgi:hypothetical protein
MDFMLNITKLHEKGKGHFILLSFYSWAIMFEEFYYLKILLQVIVTWVWTYSFANFCLVYVMYFFGIGYNFLSFWWSSWIEETNIIFITPCQFIGKLRGF